MTDTGLVDALRVVIDPHSVEADAALAGLTTMRVGGRADALVRAQTRADLVALGRICTELCRPWLIVGRGSNLLVADKGWPGVAVMLGRGFRGVEIHDDRVTAGAAEPMPALAATVARYGLGGLAFGIAIPGTAGGAVRMNAGAHGRELRDVLCWADVVRLGAGGVHERWETTRLGFAYRRSELPADAVVTSIELRLEPTDSETLEAQMDEMRRWRRENQPINEPSCGSVFRNPPGDSAGRLIEAAGMKGYRVGAAEVSRRHANFITVRRGGRAADVYTIIRAVQAAVERSQGVRLQPEVVLAGFHDDASVDHHRSGASPTTPESSCEEAGCRCEGPWTGGRVSGPERRQQADASTDGEGSTEATR